MSYKDGHDRKDTDQLGTGDLLNADQAVGTGRAIHQ
jgi:hypothetical protein